MIVAVVIGLVGESFFRFWKNRRRSVSCSKRHVVAQNTQFNSRKGPKQAQFLEATSRMEHLNLNAQNNNIEGVKLKRKLENRQKLKPS